MISLYAGTYNTLQIIGFCKLAVLCDTVGFVYYE